MKRIALFLVFICVIGLVGCNNSTAEIELDRVVMRHSSDGEASSVEVSITNKEVIGELHEMHMSLETQEMSRPIADERMWMIFYQGEDIIDEWCVSLHEDDGMLITCSSLLNRGNHVVNSEFDYNRILEIFDAASE